MARLFLLASLLAVLAGCQLVTSQPAQVPLAKSTDPQSVREEAAAAPAEKAKPQRIRTELSSRKIETESVPDPEPASDPLTLAAECLSQGDDEGAAAQLGRHVAQHSDHVVFRAQLAEILARLNRLSEAQAHFEAAAALAQSGTPVAQEKLVHYHTRLMEIARQREDEYSENLHRGIGLYLVATQLAEKGEGDDAERLFCKASTALKEAQTLRPEDARVAWYLYRVWCKLDQPRPAERALAKATATAAFSSLTPAEARALSLASVSPAISK
jgi:tetratricopeptide (TPR) repeat protein